MKTCSNCGAENPVDHAFCSNCGNALGRSCPNCGTSNEAGNKFCFNCGSGLDGAPAPTPEVAASPSSDAGERRLVSVVFADLVGYTSLSEGRDPEDIRSMLTDYYERCREIIARYGGVTDKFIGDAVMGVFGADAANEDDAERATRTALELVDMVQGLGNEVGMAGLDARAGVMSGEASVGSGGNALGLVVGDLVNTASRLQSIAPPGGVFVGETTKDLVGPAIEFVVAGEQQVKGKEILVPAFSAVRVVAHSQGRRGGELAEGPFVGRDDELRLLKDQLHATAREQSARMVSIIGEGGIGKTRLSQELVRYIDGIADTVYYHNGRSPSYGDGVTFWALGEMIRQRAGITEGEDAAKSRMKLRTTVAEFAPDEADQRWVEPRLAALIGLDDMPPGDRSELYAALRTFFQRIAERGPVLMVFEDLHWADEGLLDFIEELVERSTGSPILVLALARPEILTRRADWGASRRRSLLMHLSRLEESAMRELVAGLAPGIPEDLVGRIAERTAGVPLHAVEFVRMLINSGELVAADGAFEFQGVPGELAIPDGVSAIISARLDRLSPEEASLIQDASVLGLSFTLGGIAALHSKTPGEIEPTLRSLVRSDVLEMDENPRSPERGQYRFVQSLIKEVAYGRLPKTDRVSRHLEVARHTEELNDPELAGVIASHYASAAEADPNNAELVEKACSAIIASAERAAELHSDVQAAALYRRAIDLTTDAGERARLNIELTNSLDASGREDLAFEAGNQALEFFRSVGDQRGAAEAATCIAHTLSGNFDAARAADIIYPVYEAATQTDDEVWAKLASETSRALALSAQDESAIEVADRAIPILERLNMTEELLETLNNKAMSLSRGGRWTEGTSLLRGVAEVAAEHGLLNAEIRAINNLIATSQNDTQNESGFQDIHRLIAKSGNQAWQIRAVFFDSLNRFSKGDLVAAIAKNDEVGTFDLSDFWATAFELNRLRFETVRDGADSDRTARMLEIAREWYSSDDPQIRAIGESVQVTALHLAQDFEAAARLAVEAEPDVTAFPTTYQLGLECAALAGDVRSARGLVDRLLADDRNGRALDGLRHLATMVATALEEDVEAAVAAHEKVARLWENTMAPLDYAVAHAIAALVLSPELPVAVEAARFAEGFFTEHGFEAYLDIYAETFSRYRTADGEVAV
jgi:class 3 adenylate cyclase